MTSESKYRAMHAELGSAGPRHADVRGCRAVKCGNVAARGIATNMHRMNCHSRVFNDAGRTGRSLVNGRAGTVLETVDVVPPPPRVSLILEMSVV